MAVGLMLTLALSCGPVPANDGGGEGAREELDPASPIVQALEAGDDELVMRSRLLPSGSAFTSGEGRVARVP
jgi:hypothetical protein